MPIPFGFVEDDIFTAQAAQIWPDPKLRDERLGYITWVIARLPGDLPRIQGTNIYRVVYTESNPAITVWYTFDGSVLTLRSIEPFGLVTP